MNTTGNFVTILDHDSLQSIIELDLAFFPNPWSQKEWLELDFKTHHLFSWKVEGEVVGFALLSYLPGNDTAHLYKILLHPNFTGEGRALHFWESILNVLRPLGVKNIYLEVNANNQRAQGFYKKLGFICLRRVKAYYSNGEDGLMLNLTL